MSRNSSACCPMLITVLMATGIVTPSASVAGELRVEVASDPQVTPAEAVIEASRRFEATLLAELLRREPRLSSTRLRRVLPDLWTATQADRRERTDELLKPYGRRTRITRVSLRWKNAVDDFWPSSRRCRSRSRYGPIPAACLP